MSFGLSKLLPLGHLNISGPRAANFRDSCMIETSARQLLREDAAAAPGGEGEACLIAVSVWFPTRHMSVLRGATVISLRRACVPTSLLAVVFAMSRILFFVSSTPASPRRLQPALGASLAPLVSPAVLLPSYAAFGRACLGSISHLHRRALLSARSPVPSAISPSINHMLDRALLKRGALCQGPSRHCSCASCSRRRARTLGHVLSVREAALQLHRGTASAETVSPTVEWDVKRRVELGTLNPSEILAAAARVADGRPALHKRLFRIVAQTDAASGGAAEPGAYAEAAAGPAAADVGATPGRLPPRPNVQPPASPASSSSSASD